MTEKIDAYLEMLVEQKIKEGLDPAERRRSAVRFRLLTRILRLAASIVRTRNCKPV
jgi:hypothetical protein